MERAMYGSIDLPSAEAVAPSARERPALPKRRVSPRAAAGGLALLSIFIAAILVAVQRYDKKIETNPAATTSFRKKSALYSKPRMWFAGSSNREASSTTLDYEVENKYRTFTRLTSEYPWLNNGKLVEPYRDTTLRILNPVSGSTYIWDFYLDGSTIGQYEGTEISVYFTSTGAYDLYLRQEDENKIITESIKELVYVKYVRRELRALDDTDRVAFFDAMSTVWHTETVDGQALYGKAFYNIDYFNKYHLSQASSFSCDHMHDGLGFMTQHVALTVKFERALQAVDPSVAMHYWDFTIDGEDIFLNKDGNFSQYWFDAEVFDDDWFGRVDPNEHTMTKGRWAYTEIRKGDTDAGDVVNSYGYLRAPWNANANKYVTRYSTFCGEDYDNLVLQFPSCKVHYNAVAGYNTFKDFAWFLPYDPHGPVHVLTGGTFGCERAFVRMKDFKLGQDFYSWLGMFTFMTLKNLYRGGLLTCPDSCDEDTPQSECRCTCENFESDREAGDWAKYFKVAVAQNKQTTIVYEQDEDTQIEFIRTLCNSGIMDGDNLESASPMDPSFWPIHPAIERLYMLKKLRGLFVDETWPTTGVSSYGDDCTGHQATDTIPLQGIFEDGQSLTNEQLLDLMDPNEPTLPYVYDHFEWSHCNDVGVDFSSMTLGKTLTYGPSDSSS